MQTSFKEQRSPFIERWSTAEAVNGKLMVSVVILSALCSVLTAAVIYAALTPRPIYYIPSLQEAGTAYPQSVPDSVIGAFALSWVLNRYNFTPATIDSAYARAQKFMSPKFLAKTNLKSEMEQMKSEEASLLLSMQGDPVLAKEGNGYKVSMSGQKDMFMRGKTASTVKITYHVSLKKVSPTEANPYGLMVEDIDEDEGQI